MEWHWHISEVIHLLVKDEEITFVFRKKGGVDGKKQSAKCPLGKLEHHWPGKGTGLV